jgi:hypothetical protein
VNYAALSIREPWATLIVEGIKTTENRSWPTSHRDAFVICASKQPEPASSTGWQRLYQCAPTDALQLSNSSQSRILCGYALGIVDLVNCDQECRTEWDEPDCWHFRLANARRFARPFEWSGKLGFYTLSEELILAAQ